MTQDHPTAAPLPAYYECCADWKPQCEQVNGPIMLQAVRSGVDFYKGKPFQFCPWCGASRTTPIAASAAAPPPADQMKDVALAAGTRTFDLARAVLTHIVFAGRGSMKSGRARELIVEIFGEEIDAELARHFAGSGEQHG